MSKVKIAGVSFVPRLWDEKKNLDTLIPFYRKAVADGAQIVATVEGCLDGYPTKELPRRRLQSGLPKKTLQTAAYKKRYAAFKKKQLGLADRIKANYKYSAATSPSTASRRNPSCNATPLSHHQLTRKFSLYPVPPEASTATTQPHSQPSSASKQSPRKRPPSCGIP